MECVAKLNYQGGVGLEGRLVTPANGTKELSRFQAKYPRYSDGIAPFLIQDLARYHGAKTANAIHQFCIYNNIPSEVIGKELVIYTSPVKLESLFHDTTTQDYLRLLDEVKNGRFNLIVQSPFGIYNTKTLMQEPEAEKSESRIRLILEGDIVPIIGSLHNEIWFVVAESDSHIFIPRYSDKTSEERKMAIEQFNKSLRKRYNRFLAKLNRKEA